MFPPGTKILIVDDMKTMRLLLRKSLADLGLKSVVEAGDGEQAWNEACKALEAGAPFELIISDWIMPKTKGIHLLSRVRGNSRMKHTPFIMLTGENEAESIREAVAAGVTAYVLKPFQLETLRQKLEGAFASSRQDAPAKKTA